MRPGTEDVLPGQSNRRPARRRLPTGEHGYHDIEAAQGRKEGRASTHLDSRSSGSREPHALNPARDANPDEPAPHGLDSDRDQPGPIL